jgi:hypothetical protein
MLPPVPTLCGKTLIVPLGVFPPPVDKEEPTMVCAPFLVPKGIWTIVWNLVTLHEPRGKDDPEPLQATFAEKGIAPLFGQEVKLLTPPWQVSPTQWAVSIDNQTEKRADALSYDIAIQYGPANNSGDRRVYRANEICHHDPTIVVTKDPIEPDGYR